MMLYIKLKPCIPVSWVGDNLSLWLSPWPGSEEQESALGAEQVDLKQPSVTVEPAADQSVKSASLAFLHQKCTRLWSWTNVLEKEMHSDLRNQSSFGILNDAFYLERSQWKFCTIMLNPVQKSTRNTRCAQNDWDEVLARDFQSKRLFYPMVSQCVLTFNKVLCSRNEVHQEMFKYDTPHVLLPCHVATNLVTKGDRGFWFKCTSQNCADVTRTADREKKSVWIS